MYYFYILGVIIGSIMSVAESEVEVKNVYLDRQQNPLCCVQV